MFTHAHSTLINRLKP